MLVTQAPGCKIMEWINNSYPHKSLYYNDLSMTLMKSMHRRVYIYIYIYIYIMYMWQMSSVFSHESAQRNDAGHLIDKDVPKNDRVVLKTFLSIYIYMYIYIYMCIWGIYITKIDRYVAYPCPNLVQSLCKIGPVNCTIDIFEYCFGRL